MHRAVFEKKGNAIWISHLDLMRVLQRSFRRAGLLLKHSQGFTPHPCLSLALPLSVGVSSCCEIMDFELEDGQDETMLCERLNAVLPEGIVLHCVYEGGRKVKELSHLRVAITMEYDKGIPVGCTDAIRALFQRDELLMEKKTKSGAIVMQNILEMMKEISLEEKDANTLVMICIVCAQNPSLNPSVITAAIVQELPDFAPDYSSVARLCVLDAEGNEFQ